MKHLIQLLAFLLVIHSATAKLDETILNQLDHYYHKADYKTGLQKVKEEIRSAERKKDSLKQSSLAILYSYRALFQKSLSKEKEFILSVSKARENLKDVTPGLHYSIAYSLLCEALLLDLQVLNAVTLRKEEEAKLNTCLHLNGVIRDRILLADWRLKYSNGNYSAILKNLPADAELIKAAIVEKDSVKVRSKMKFVKLSSSEIRNRKNRYSECILLLSRTYLNNGYPDSALAVLQRHEVWTKKELNYHEGALANILFEIAQVYNVLDDHTKALAYVRKASGASLKFYAQHAPLRIEIQELLINILIASQRYEEADIYNNDLDVKVLGYYGKNSFGYHRNKYIDIEHLILNHAWKKAENDLVEYAQVKIFYPAGHSFRLKAGRDLFRILLRNNKLEEAEKLLDSTITLARIKYGEESPYYQLFLLEKAAYHATYTDKFKEAENEFSAAFAKLNSDLSSMHPEVLYYQYKQAELFIETEQFDQADKCYNQILGTLAKYPGEQSFVYAAALSHVVALDVVMGRYNQADERIKKAVAILEKTESEKYKGDLIHCLEASSRLSIIQGDFLGANKQILQAAKILRKSDGETSTAAFEELTRLNIYFGKFQRTETDLNEVIALREKRFGKMHRALWSPLNQLAYLKIVTGSFMDAEELLQRSSMIANQVYGDQSIKFAETLLLQKQLYTVAGDYEKAQLAIEKAVEITIKKFGKDHIRSGMLMHELALARFINTGQTSKGILTTTSEESSNDNSRGIKDKDKKKKKPGDKKTTSKRNQELPVEPEPLLNLSISIIKTGLGENTPALAEALENAASYNLSKNNYVLALDNISRAMAIWNSRLTEKNLRSGKLLLLQGAILQAKGEYAQSLESYTKALNLLGSIFDENHPDYITALGKCAQLHYINGHSKEAVSYSTKTIDKSLSYIDKIFPGLSERGKAAYWEKAKHDFDFFKTIALVNAERDPSLIARLMDLQIRTKAILLNSSIKVKKRILSSGDSILIGNYQKWQALRENLATALSMSAEQRKEVLVDANKIQEEIEQLERKLSASSELFAKNYDQQNYDWEALKKTLAPGELFIEVVPFRYFDKKFTDTTWYAFLFIDNTTKSNPSYTVIKEGHLLGGKFLKYYRNCVRFEMTDEYSYSKFWEPLQKNIPEKTKTILFDSDGAYNQLNVETFRTPEGTYLLDRYNIVLIGTARDVLEGSAKTKSTGKVQTGATYVFVGNPIYYQADYSETKNVAQLYGAEQEVKAINAQVQSQNKQTSLLLNNAATESSVKELQYPEVFHIATHGFFLTDVSDETGDEFSERAIQNPLLRSGLLLQKGGQILQQENLYAINREEGVLTAYEAMNLNFDNTKLVVLSACETGLGEVKIGEGVYGLQRSFLVAGAESIVMSLFKVNDEVTKELMLEFYKRWQGGERKRTAFVNAKREILKKYPSPKYWGSFIMIGLN